MRNVLVNTFARLRNDEKGVTLVEYGIAIMLAVTVGAGALIGLAGEVDGRMDTACNVLGTTVAANGTASQGTGGC